MFTDNSFKVGLENVWFHLHEVIVKFTKTVECWLLGTGGEENEELLFNGRTVSVWEDKKSSGDGWLYWLHNMWMCLMSLKKIVKITHLGYVYLTTIFFKAMFFIASFSRSKASTNFSFLLREQTRAVTLLKGHQPWAWCLIISWSCSDSQRGDWWISVLSRPRHLYIRFIGRKLARVLKSGRGRGGRLAFTECLLYARQRANQVPGIQINSFCPQEICKQLSASVTSLPSPIVEMDRRVKGKRHILAIVCQDAGPKELFPEPPE